MNSTKLYTEAVTMFEAIKKNLSADSQHLITNRMQRWQKQEEVAARLKQAGGPQPVLVMRPGLPPRPLDPFYFVLTHDYDN